VVSKFRVALLGASIAANVVAAAAPIQSRVQAPARVDVQQVGPQVGTRVPDFSLPDQGGRLRTLGSLMGPRGVVLVFFRSADW
jgi:Peroxiredoxin